MTDDLVKVTVSEGKYTFGQRKDGSCYALRYGEPWREDIFDGLTLAMAHHIEVLEAAFSNLSREYDKRADRIEELEAKLEALDHAYDSIVQALRFEALRTDDAESKLAKAVETISLCRKMQAQFTHTEDPLMVLLDTTIAELKGQDHE